MYFLDTGSFCQKYDFLTVFITPQVVDYSTMLTEVKAINSDTNIANVWVSFHCNYAIYSALSNKVSVN